jgi:hypothetical protein
MNVAFSSQFIRRLRIASLWTFWLSLIAIPALSPFDILAWTPLFGIFWFIAPFVAAAVAVVAIGFYFFALALGRAQVRDEFVAVLTGGDARARPIILLLLPFDFAEPRIIERTADLFFGGLLMESAFLGGAAIAATAQPMLNRPIGYGMSAVEQAVAGAFWRGVRDAATELDDAIIDSQAVLVAIGDKYLSCESDKIRLNERDGAEVFRRFAEVAALIIMVPDMSLGILWELSHIVTSSDFLAKTVFIMSRGTAQRRGELVAHAASKLGVALPGPNDNGCVFRLTSDRRPGEAVSLEAFTRGLQAYLESQSADSTFCAAQLWKSVESSQNNYLAAETMESPVLPQTAHDWAQRVSVTGYVEDGEALIKQLGGSVVYQELGEIFTREKITVHVSGQEHSFESKYDMVQWIIKDLVPTVPSGPAKPLSN